MLLNLHVKNLALIDEIEVEFGDHLNILTGETGAGKSILLGSMNAALGNKISKDMIRQGSRLCICGIIVSYRTTGSITKNGRMGVFQWKKEKF